MGAFESYLGGRQARQQEQIRGARLTGMLEAENTRKAQARKKEQFIGMLGGQVPEQYRPLVKTGGLQGYEAVQDIMKQDTAAQEAEIEKAGTELGQAVPGIIRVKDEEEWASEVLPWLEQMSQKAGVPQETFDQVASLPMRQSQEAIAQMVGVDMPKPEDDRLPVSGVEILVSPNGKQKSYDIGDPVQRKAYQAGIDKGDRPFIKETKVGKPSDYGTKKEIETLRETEIATRGAIATANKMLAMDESAFQDAASFTRILSGAGAEINALIDLVGVEEGETIDTLRDASRYTSEFEKLGIDSTVAQGHALDLALAYAGAIGLGTNRALSDRDIKLALNRIGINGLKTPAARKAAIESVRDVLDERYRIRHEVITGKPFEGNLGIPAAATPVLDALNEQFPEGGSNKFAPDGTEYKFVDGVWREV